MRKVVLIAGVTLGIVVLLIGVLIGYAVLNLNSIIASNREYILRRVSESLGRPVEVQDIKAAVGWGVAVEIGGVKIADDPAFSQLPFVEAAQVSGELEFIPLLVRQLKVTRLVLIKPDVRLLRNSEGVLNVSSLGKRAPSGEAEEAEEKGAAERRRPSQRSAEGGSSALGALAITRFAVEDAKVYYRDATQRGQPFELSHVDVDVDNFSLAAPFDARLSLALLSDRQNLTVAGKLGPLMRAGALDVAKLPLAIKASVGPLLLDRVRTLAVISGKIPPKLSMPDPVSLEADANGNLAALAFRLSTDLSAARVLYLGVFNKPAGTRFKIAAAGARRGSEMSISHAELKLADLDLKATDTKLSGGVLAAHVDTNRFDLESVGKTVAAMAKYRATGKAEIHGRGQLVSGKPRVDGTVTLAGVGFGIEGAKLPMVTDLNGNIRLAENSAVIEPTTFSIGSGHARLEARAESLEPVRASFMLKADTLKLAEFVASRPADAQEQIRQFSVSGTVGGELSAPDVTAQLGSSEGLVAGVPYRNLALAAEYGSKRLIARSLKLDAYGGSLAGNGAVRLGDLPEFEVALSPQGIDLEQALRAQKAKAAEVVRGQLSGNFKVSGRGANFDQIKPTLKGDGRAAISNGKLVGVNIVGQTLNKVKGIPEIGTLVSPSVVQRYPALFNSPDTDLKKASLTFDLTGPRITSHDITVQSTDYVMTGDGWFDMDKNIDLLAHITMSKQFSDDLRAEKKNVVYLTDAQGQIDLPVVIRGTLPKPSILPDIQTLVQRAASHAVEKHGKKLLRGLLEKKGLGGILGGGEGESAPGAAGTPAPQPTPINPLAPFRGFFR